MAAMGFPSLTPLSSFNSWALSLAAFRSGEMELAALEQEFAGLAREMSQISAVFRSEARYQEQQPPWDRLLAQALGQLERCEDQLYLLHETATQSAWDQLDEAQVSRLGTSITLLFETFAQIREAEAQRPRLADSPYIHELLRCLKLFDQQKLSRELIEERLLSVSHHFLQLQAQIENSPVRLPAVEQLLDILELQQTAFDQLLEALQQNQRPLPEGPRKILHDCAREALAVHQEVLDLQGTQAGWCVECGGIVAAADGLCAECGQPIETEDGDQGILGLVELAQQTCQNNQPESWAQLSNRLTASLQQLEEVTQKAGALPERKVELEAALARLKQVLTDLQLCTEARDGSGLHVQVALLEQALAAAQAAQNDAIEEMTP